MLTDRGSCFTADAFEVACERHGVQHRKTRPYTPKANGMVERSTGGLGITLYGHAALKIVLRGFNAAYNGRRQRVLNGLWPEMVLRQRPEADPALDSFTYKPPSPSLIEQALRIVEVAKEVSHPDTCSGPRHPLQSEGATTTRMLVAAWILALPQSAIDGRLMLGTARCGDPQRASK